MIRAYTSDDFNACIELLLSATPKYFHPSEEEDYRRYLQTKIDEYFVYERDGGIIGAGGINYLFNEHQIRISWDIIHPSYHSMGIGSELLNFRVHKILQTNPKDQLIVRTSQQAYLFYQKNGFKIKDIVKDYWAEGFDLYEMTYEN